MIASLCLHLTMSFDEYLKSRALYSGKLFATDRRATAAATTTAERRRRQFLLPNVHCGFRHSVLRRRPIRCQNRIDPKGVVSLALLDRKTQAIRDYANKLPIICVNVNRLTYTLDAFLLRYSDDETIDRALQFYIGTDIDELARSTTLEPNERFSRFLHLLRSDGYENYLFALARHLDLNVDLVRCGDDGGGDGDGDVKLFVRYRRTKFNELDLLQNSSQHHGDHYLHRATESSSSGTLTAVHHGDQWYVRLSPQPIIV